MGTRSYIAYSSWNENEVHASYCHYDSYLEHNGFMLYGFYRSMLKARRLVDSGCISSLRRLPAECERTNKDPVEIYDDLTSFVEALDPLYHEYVYIYLDKPHLERKGWYWAKAIYPETEDTFFHVANGHYTAFKPLGRALSRIDLPKWYDSRWKPVNYITDSEENTATNTSMTVASPWHIPISDDV